MAYMKDKVENNTSVQINIKCDQIKVMMMF